jgi:sigma-B regulation protein RsbU (phosphoserine phosphatase)
VPQSFWFDIPPAHETEFHATPLRDDVNRGSVLIADDQPTVLEALRMMLKSEGYVIELASTPQAALQAVEARPFDAVIIDLNYTLDTTSGIEGMDLLTRIKQARPETPVVVMTAWASLETAIEAMRRGASDFIQKPWDNSQVLNTVRAQVMRGQLHQRASNQRDFEMADATEVQKALLPREMPSLPGYEVAAWLQPARGVTGDYYDLFRLDDDHLFLCIGDVAGKGTPAALLMANLQGTLKTLVLDERSPAKLCERLNALITPNLQGARFVTFFCAILDLRSGRLSYSNAGHLAPVIVRNSSCIARLQRGGSVLGRHGTTNFDQGEFTLIPGDSVVLFTDGVTEAGAQDGEEEFGEERMLRIIDTRTSPSASALRDAISNAVIRHSATFHDDATLITLRRM